MYIAQNGESEHTHTCRCACSSMISQKKKIHAHSYWSLMLGPNCLLAYTHVCDPADVKMMQPHIEKHEAWKRLRLTPGQKILCMPKYHHGWMRLSTAAKYAHHLTGEGKDDTKWYCNLCGGVHIPSAHLPFRVFCVDDKKEGEKSP